MVRRASSAAAQPSAGSDPVPDRPTGHCYCDGCGAVVRGTPVICSACPGVFHPECVFGHRNTVSGLVCEAAVPAPNPTEPSPEPANSADRSLSPPVEGRWTDGGILPKPPKVVSRYDLENWLQKAGVGKATKVYIVHPGPWPGVHLSWTSVSKQAVGIRGTHQCSGKRGLFPALETVRGIS